MKSTYPTTEASKFDLTPMIDIVFLMLIFFMVSTQLIRQEADIGLQLPYPKPAPKELPSKHVVDILPDGTVLLNGGEVAANQDHENLAKLSQMLTSLKHSADRLNMDTFITIQADAHSPHYRSIDVLNACAESDLQFVSFSRI